MSSNTTQPSTEQGSSQTERATLAVREMLVHGKFRPGERLREVPLAKQLGVSRIPLRLALERLAHEGFLEMRPTRGFIAQQFEIADIYDAIDLRGTIEGMAARLAAERISGPEEAKPLGAIHEELAQVVRGTALTLDSVAKYIALNAQFHNEILRLSRSRRLVRAIEQVCSLPFASPNAFLRSQFLAPESHELFLISVEHHRAIHEAIASREGARAEAVAREHARVARRNLETALEHRSLGDLVPGLKLITR